MADSIKCPNCGSNIFFDIEKQKAICAYCLNEYSAEQLESFLVDAMAQDTTTFISLHADENRPYSEIVNVLDIANKNKLKIVLATKPADKE